jgi:DNA adenine methylase
MKTFIRWQGNKSRYIKYLLPHIPSDYDRYIEPFVGSGAIFLHIMPTKWIINDLNADLINTWLQIKKNTQLIVKYLLLFQKQIQSLNREEQLKYVRVLLKKMVGLSFSPYRAALFLIVKFSAFMGIIIQNNKYLIPSLVSDFYQNEKLCFTSTKYIKKINELHIYLNTTQGKIYNDDYKKILKMTKKNDFVFLDPPYLEIHNYQFNYNKDQNINGSFEDELLKELIKLDNKNVKWLMTQADTPEIRKLFKNYKISSFRVYRRSSNTYKNELIIKNY